MVVDVSDLTFELLAIFLTTGGTLSLSLSMRVRFDVRLGESSVGELEADAAKFSELVVAKGWYTSS